MTMRFTSGSTQNPIETAHLAALTIVTLDAELSLATPDDAPAGVVPLDPVLPHSYPAPMPICYSAGHEGDSYYALEYWR